MKSFLTGSRAYGTPHPDSDIDLVVLANEDEAREFIWSADVNNGGQTHSGDGNDVSLRFSRLNLIVLTDPEKFDLWQKATEALTVKRPVTREQAVDYHREHVDAALAMSRQADNDFCNP